MPKKGYKPTCEHRKNLSLAHMGNKPTEETIEKMRLSAKTQTDNRGRFKKGNVPYNTGRPHSSETIAKIKKSCKGHTSWNKGLTVEDDARLQGACSSMLQKWSDPAWIKNMSDQAKARWADPEWAEMQAAKLLHGNKTIRPNKPEKKLLELLNTIFPNTMKYTGDGSFWIMGRNPDFININGKKQAIELLGCYWHGCPEHFPDVKKQKKFNAEVKLLKGFGYSTLGVWEHELEDIVTLTMKLVEFIEA